MDDNRFQDADIVLQRCAATQLRILKTTRPEDFAVGQVVTESHIMKWFAGFTEPVDVLWLPLESSKPVSLTGDQAWLVLQALRGYTSDRETGDNDVALAPYYALIKHLQGE